MDSIELKDLLCEGNFISKSKKNKRNSNPSLNLNSKSENNNINIENSNLSFNLDDLLNEENFIQSKSKVKKDKEDELIKTFVERKVKLKLDSSAYEEVDNIDGSSFKFKGIENDILGIKEFLNIISNIDEDNLYDVYFIIGALYGCKAYFDNDNIINVKKVTLLWSSYRSTMYKGIKRCSNKFRARIELIRVLEFINWYCIELKRQVDAIDGLEYNKKEYMIKYTKKTINIMKNLLSDFATYVGRKSFEIHKKKINRKINRKVKIKLNSNRYSVEDAVSILNGKFKSEYNK